MQEKLNPDKILVPGSRIVVSACLLGIECNYKSEASSAWQKRPDFFTGLLERYIIIPVCPEQLGGLATPRIPAELTGLSSEVFKGNADVVTRSGDNVTACFVKGARESLRIAQLFGAKSAILKTRSPSCGKKMVYDGTFSGVLIEGPGLTAHLFKESGIEVFDEEDFL